MRAVHPNFPLPTIRPLTADDCGAYRCLRQRVLALGDGCYFSDSYTREAELTESQWRAWCTETPEHCIFGIFDKSRLIGVMMITQHGAPEDRIAEWEAIWLEPSYRKQGIAKLAYEQVQQWTLDQGYRYVVLYIRDGNLRSQEIHRKQGACYIYTRAAEVWADGSVGDTLAYFLDISAPTPEMRARKTLRYLEEALVHLGNGMHPPQSDGREISNSKLPERFKRASFP